MNERINKLNIEIENTYIENKEFGYDYTIIAKYW